MSNATKFWKYNYIFNSEIKMPNAQRPIKRKENKINTNNAINKSAQHKIFCFVSVN